MSGGLGAGVGFDVNDVELSLSVLHMAIGEHLTAPDAKVTPVLSRVVVFSLTQTPCALVAQASVWRRLVLDAPCVVFVLGHKDSSVTRLCL